MIGPISRSIIGQTTRGIGRSFGSIKRFIIDLFTSTNASTTDTGATWCFNFDAVLANGMVLKNIPVGYPRMIGARWLAPGWSAVDTDGVPLTNAMAVADVGTNLRLQSNTFTTSWTLGNGMQTPTQDVVGPDGQVNSGWTFTGDNSTGNEFIFSAAAAPITSGDTTTNTIFIKAGTRRYLEIVSGPGANGFGVVLDTVTMTIVDTGVSGTGVYESSSIVHSGNGWYCLTITGHLNISNNGFTIVHASDSATWQGGTVTVTPSVLTWFQANNQFEIGSIPTPYKETTVTTVTSDADVNTVATPSVLTPESGAIEMVVDPAATGQGVVYALYSLSAVASTYLQLMITSSDVRLYKVYAGDTSLRDIFSYTHTANVNMTIQLFWDGIDGFGIRAFDTGDAEPAFAPDTDTSDMPIGSLLNIGNKAGGALFIGDYANNGLPKCWSSKEAAGW